VVDNRLTCDHACEDDCLLYQRECRSVILTPVQRSMLVTSYNYNAASTTVAVGLRISPVSTSLETDNRKRVQHT